MVLIYNNKEQNMVKGRVEIYAEACKSCLYCVETCPRGVLSRSDGTNSKGYQYIAPLRPELCIGCGLCARICPDAAISVYKEEQHG